MSEWMSALNQMHNDKHLYVNKSRSRPYENERVEQYKATMLAKRIKKYSVLKGKAPMTIRQAAEFMGTSDGEVKTAVALLPNHIEKRKNVEGIWTIQWIGD